MKFKYHILPTLTLTIFILYKIHYKKVFLTSSPSTNSKGLEVFGARVQ